jgi:hypothetical protein
MIDVSEILNDPDLCEPFTALRSTDGTWQAGVFVQTPIEVALYGPVQVADANTLQQVPEADRAVGARVFWSVSPIYETHAGDTPGTSDLLIHCGTKYKVTKVWNWPGYCKAYAVRTKGS